MLQSLEPVKDVPETNFGNMRELSDEEILTIAHRKATRYTHEVAPGEVTYGFSVAHLLDFARAVLEKARTNGTP